MGDKGQKYDIKNSVVEQLTKFRKAMQGEMGKALRTPKSEHGGPVRISSGTPMKFPYTFTAKLMQFPWKFYVRNNWIWKYYFIAVLVSMPVFKKISNMSNSPANKAKWAEMRQKEKHEHHGH